MAMKNLEVKKAGATERARSSAVGRTESAKPTIKTKNGGGFDGSMKMDVGRACKSLYRQSEGRDR